MEEKKYLNKIFTYKLIYIPIFIIITLLFFLPLLVVFYKSLSVSNIFSVLKDKYINSVFKFTIFQAFISALLSTIIGIYGAYLSRFINKKNERLLISILALPFLLPSILVVLGFINIWGNNGIFNIILKKIFNVDYPILNVLYSFKAIIMAHIFYNIPLSILIIRSYWNKIGNNMEASSYLLGINKFKTFFTITLRRLLPAILSSFLLIFLYCFHSFAIVLMLGGDPKLTTLEVEIYRRSRDINLFSSAASLSIYSLLFCLIIALIYFYFQKEKFKEKNNYFLEQKKLKGFQKVLGITFTVILLLFLYLPIISIIIRSFFVDNKFSFLNYSKLFSNSDFIESVFNSVNIALLSSIFTTIAAFALAHSLRFSNKSKNIFKQLFIILPLATSSIIIGFGYYLISIYLRNFSNIIICSIAHMIISVPIAASIVKQNYDKLSINTQKSALLLGANKTRLLLTVDLPYLKHALFASFIITFAISIGELNSTLVITSSDFTTLPVLLYYSITTHDIGLSSTIGSLLMLICIIITSIIYSGVKNE